MIDDLSTADALAARIRRLEIRAELSDLISGYGNILDAKGWDEIGEYFAIDGGLTFGGTTVTGRAALKEFFAASLSGYEFTFHYPNSQVFEIVDDEHATGVVCGHAEHSLDGTCLLAGVRYDDRYVFEDGRWRIAHRAIGSRYFLSWPELAEAFHEGALSSRLGAS